MVSLVIDTATRFCGTCIFDAGADRVLAAIEEEIGRGHAERLPGMIIEVMNKAAIGFNALTGITATIGPGSFTGIRVGVAAARGFALARDLSVTGVTTLETLAVQVRAEAGPDGPFAVLIGGGRDQVFLQHFGGNVEALDAAQAVPETDIAPHIRSDATLLAGDAAKRTGMSRPMVADRPVGTIEAVARAALCFSRPPTPLYLRGADAKPQAGFALPRQAGARIP